MHKFDRIIIFDTETTGLTLHPTAPLSKQPKIIEFGAIILEQGEVVEEFSTLINPQESLSDEIVKITGITDDDLRDLRPFSEHIESLTKLFNKCAGVAAHNLPFDKAMLMNELKRCAAVQKFPWPPREMCTVGIYKEQWGRNPKLLELYADIMGKPLAQTHRALGDVKALVEIIQEEELWALA
jgi:DNA polymerase III epsilon subunit-like protein